VDLTLYYHPFSNFCQKTLVALYETGASFEPRLIDLGNADDRAELGELWPLVKFPVLRDSKRGTTIAESSLIVAYIDRHYPGREPLIPDDFDVALEVHLIDRLVDNYLMTPTGKVVIDQFRAEGRHDPDGVEQAKSTIATAYKILESRLAGHGWAVGNSFTLADCGAGPALFYTNTIVPLESYPKLAAYYRRLLDRPSFARAVEEARPYRAGFPLPWPAGYE
jgi:glutathione S-transferase